MAEPTIKDVRAWVEAARKDGWAISATYSSESVERAAKLEREGWNALAIMRPQGLDGTWPVKDCASLSVWGPDGLQINVPSSYSWKACQEALSLCNVCGQKSKDVERASFAGRYCNACHKKEAPNLYYRGWAD